MYNKIALPHVSSKSSDEEKEMFFFFFFIARVERLPVTSRSHVTDRQTNVRLVYIMMSHANAQS